MFKATFRQLSSERAEDVCQPVQFKVKSRNKQGPGCNSKRALKLTVCMGCLCATLQDIGCISLNFLISFSLLLLGKKGPGILARLCDNGMRT